MISRNIKQQGGDQNLPSNLVQYFYVIMTAVMARFFYLLMVVTTTTDKQKDFVLHQQKKSKVYIKDSFNALIFDLHFDLCYKFKFKIKQM